MVSQYKTCVNTKMDHKEVKENMGWSWRVKGGDGRGRMGEFTDICIANLAYAHVLVPHKSKGGEKAEGIRSRD